MKDWSIGKILGVMAGVFVALLVVTLIVVNMVKSHRSSSTSTLVSTAPPTLSAPRQHDGLLDDQLQQVSEKIDVLQQQSDKQGQQTQQNNQSIMANFTTIQSEVKALSDRVNALEHPNTGPVEVVKPVEKPRVPETKRLARVSKAMSRRSGYQTEAVVANRAWMRVNGVETKRATGEDLPQVSQPERIEAMSADSGVYVVPSH